jgi:hypothetical protein
MQTMNKLDELNQIDAEWVAAKTKRNDTAFLASWANQHGPAIITLARQSAEQAARVSSLEAARPLIECIADWERENGTLAAIMPDEYRGFCERMAKAAIHGSARAALNQKGPAHD